MLRWARGKTRLDHIRNEDTRKEAHVKPVETFLENKRLKWFGHCLRREPNHYVQNRCDYSFLGGGTEADREKDGGTTYRET